VIGGNLRSIEVTPREKARLDKAGLSEDTLQWFAVWRRSVLFAVIGPTLLSAVLATADTATQGMTGLSPLGKFLTAVSTLILYALPFSAVAALFDWTHLKRSHRWLLWGWTLAFLPPFALALLPQGWWFTPSDVPEQRAAERLEWAVLDVLKGIYFYCTLMPAVLSLLTVSCEAREDKLLSPDLTQYGGSRRRPAWSSTSRRKNRFRSNSPGRKNRTGPPPVPLPCSGN
jgi:hypothetical protein